MKITKLIREYVEEQVSKVYDAKQNPYSEQAALDRQKIEDFKAYLKKQQAETIKQFTLENELYTSNWSGSKVTPYEVHTEIPYFGSTYTKTMLDEIDWNEANIKAKNAKIREIMITLELGANRQELNDMIAKLMEEQQ